MMINKTHQTATHSKPSYRLEIDGMRALAVVAVIINHFNKEILPSGYLGVDIFFVISGFVITSSLAYRSSKNFSDFLAGFYTRRIKRLVPALVIFVVITSILICLFNPNPEVSLTTGITSLFGFSNLYLFNQATDYFAPSTELNVFTHTWSLGVEEQFYFLFPFIAWFSGFSRFTSQGSKYLFLIMGSLAVASLISFIYLYDINQSAAYFLMPTRFWEMAAGCLLFLGLKKSNSFLKSLEKVNPLLITVTIIGVLFVPLKFAVLTTITIVILTGILIICLRSGTATYNFFTEQRVVYIGSISYSLYLWHWGVLSLSQWTFGIHLWSIPLQIILMLCLSIFSYRYIETPLRSAQWSILRWQSITYGIATSLTSALILSWLISINSFLLFKGINDIPSPPDFLPLKNSGLPFNPTCVVDHNKRPLTSETFEQCTILPKGNSSQMIWSLGDSHIGHLQGLLYAVHEQTGLGIHLIETPGIPFPMTKKKYLKEREIIYKNIEDKLKPGDLVLVSRLFLDYTQKNELMKDIPEWNNNVLKLADLLAKQEVNLIIMGPSPIFEVEDIELCRSSLWSDFRNYCSTERAPLSQQINKFYASFLSKIKTRNNIYLFDQFDLLCPQKGDKCSVFSNGILFYRDRDHLNTYGASYLSSFFLDFLTENQLLKN